MTACLAAPTTCDLPGSTKWPFKRNGFQKCLYLAPGPGTAPAAAGRPSASARAIENVTRLTLLDDDDEHGVAAAAQLVQLRRARRALQRPPLDQAVHLRSASRCVSVKFAMLMSAGLP